MEQILKVFIENKKIFLFSFLSLLCGFSLGFVISYKYVKQVDSDANTEVNLLNESKSLDIASEKASCDIQVEISGAVKNPNVYCLDKEAILLDAIQKAGGFSKDYASKYVASEVNLSQKVNASQKFYIPFSNEIKCTKYHYVLVPDISTNVDNPVEKKCVSINTGTKEDLMTLSGVGESMAQKIITGRPYKTVAELDNVSGIGEQLLLKLKPYVCF